MSPVLTSGGAEDSYRQRCGAGEVYQGWRLNSDHAGDAGGGRFSRGTGCGILLLLPLLTFASSSSSIADAVTPAALLLPLLFLQLRLRLPRLLPHLLLLLPLQRLLLLL